MYNHSEGGEPKPLYLQSRCYHVRKKGAFTSPLCTDQSTAPSWSWPETSGRLKLGTSPRAIEVDGPGGRLRKAEG